MAQYTLSQNLLHFPPLVPSAWTKLILILSKVSGGVIEGGGSVGEEMQG